MTRMSACPAVGELRGWRATFAVRSASCDSVLGKPSAEPPDGTAASYAADVDAVPEDNRLVIDNQRTKSCASVRCQRIRTALGYTPRTTSSADPRREPAAAAGTPC